MRSPIYNELASFKKSIKREASSYSTLKDERYFDKFQRDLFITAKSHDVSEILDPTFTPGPSPEEKELFEAKQIFMYKVFNETLLTDMGRTKVRKYLKTTDVQAVWKEYSEYMTTASKGASEKRKLTQYVTNTVLVSQFRGTSQQFVLHFNEQFRRLDELTDLAEKMPESKKWPSFRMQSRTSHNSVLLRHLMNTPLQLLEQVLVPSLPIHPITTCSSMLVLGMMQPILPPLPRGGMYIQLLELKISMLLKTPMKHISIMTLTHHQMTSIRYTKLNKANHHLHPYLGFREITPESQLPLQPRNLSKNILILYMSLQKFISSSTQRLLLPSRMIQFPPKMDENWLRYELLNLGQIYETKLAEDVVLCVHNTTSALNR